MNVTGSITVLRLFDWMNVPSLIDVMVSGMECVLKQGIAVKESLGDDRLDGIGP